MDGWDGSNPFYVEAEELDPNHALFVQRMTTFLNCWHRHIPVVVRNGTIIESAQWTLERIIEAFSSVTPEVDVIVNSATELDSITMTAVAFLNSILGVK